MGLGIRIRRLWRHKAGIAISLLVAIVAALWSVDRISLFPPRLTPRSLEMATATTHILVDTPRSVMVNLREGAYNLQDLTNRAVVLGNVIVSPGVEASIAQKAHVPLSLLRIEAPLTTSQAALPANSQNNRKLTDITKLNNQYGVNLEVDPEVPMLDVYAQTPSAQSAGALANAVVDSLNEYLTHLASNQRTPRTDQVKLVQLGRAKGSVVNPGVKYQMALLVFILTFLASCATVVYVARIRAGWRRETLSENVTSA